MSDPQTSRDVIPTSGVVRLVCERCGNNRSIAEDLFIERCEREGFPVTYGLPHDHPRRCRLRDGKEWCCGKLVGHVGACSCHTDCGFEYSDGSICGAMIGHSFPHVPRNDLPGGRAVAPAGGLGICAHKFDSTVCVAPANHEGPHVTSNERFPHGLAFAAPASAELNDAAVDAASHEYLRVFATHREALVAAIRVYVGAAAPRDATPDEAVARAKLLVEAWGFIVLPPGSPRPRDVTREHSADCNVVTGRRSADHRIHCDCGGASLLWSAGDLIGVANLVAEGLDSGESIESFCRRVLSRAIADGLVK